LQKAAVSLSYLFLRLKHFFLSTSFFDDSQVKPIFKSLMFESSTTSFLSSLTDR
jgi:hypothetical protein